MPRLVLAVMSTALLLLPSSALARDYADTARNVVPSGQWGRRRCRPARTRRRSSTTR